MVQGHECCAVYFINLPLSPLLFLCNWLYPLSIYPWFWEVTEHTTSLYALHETILQTWSFQHLLRCFPATVT